MKNRFAIIALLMLSIGIVAVAIPSKTQHRKKAKKSSATTRKKRSSNKKSTIIFEPNTYVTHFHTSGDTATWIEAQLAAMTDSERVGQLFNLPVWTNKDSINNEKALLAARRFNLGGITLMQGSANRHARLVNQLQASTKTPLMFAMDDEWGLAMRVENITSFPHELTLGAIQNDSLIEEMGYRIAKQGLRLGITVNFAPVVDINSNAANPVINDRSFGEDATKVTNKGIAYMKGLQRAGAMACAKHFPGHGATSVDSHFDLPVLDYSRQHLDSLDLIPFKALINQGVQSVMVAHLAVPAIEPDLHTPASLSGKIITGILKEEYGFQGLTFTDALNMKGVANYFAGGNADLKALLAGNDVLLFGDELPAAVGLILNAVKKELISQEEIDNRVRKVLYYKYKLGLNKFQPITTAQLLPELNASEAFIQQLYNEAITCIPANKSITFLTPNGHFVAGTTASLSIGNDTLSAFQKQVQKQLNIACFHLPANAMLSDYAALQDTLNKFPNVIIDIHSMSRFNSKDYGLSSALRDFLQSLDVKTQHCNVFFFGNPYALKFANPTATNWVMYEDNAFTHQTAANALLGLIPVKGKLPVSASAMPQFKAGSGATLKTAPLIKKQAVLPNFSSPLIGKSYLHQIDSLVDDAITQKAFPGCEIVVMKNGELFYRKAFGAFTYESSQAVDNTDLYDLASITKIAATTLCCMKLVEEGRLNLNKTIYDYLPEAKKTNKKKIKVKDLLLHQAGLVPFLPFYKNCIDANGNWGANLAAVKDAKHQLQVAANMFIDSAYVDTMWQMIYKSEIKTPGKYVYSDLDMYFMKRICERILGNETMESYLNRNFYQPMGLKRMCYNPLSHGFPTSDIAPTEQDNLFRKQLICGYVHDPGAAMSGGVQGHAGLFSNATDLAVLMAMLCNEGVWQQKTYLEKQTVTLFTTKQSKVSRRGLGFDKQSPDPTHDSPTCKSASPATFGHTGFTGTSVWADPENGLVFVFLSNRVYPIAENKKIIQLNVRTNLQELFYRCLNKK